MSRPSIVAGNWKMNRDARGTADFFADFFGQGSADPVLESAREYALKGDLGVYLFPPLLSLLSALEATEKQRWLRVGTQNFHWKEAGAFTGEVSLSMFHEIGIRSGLVGHSERRQFFGETDSSVALKTEAALEAGVQPMVCLGETLAQREAGQTAEVLCEQIRLGLPQTPALRQSLETPGDGGLLLAYEPVWAIGTGQTATPQQAQEAHELIRLELRERFGEKAAQNTPILYGGSVKPQNFGEILEGPDVDGALVGGASLDPESFKSLLEVALSHFSKHGTSS